MTLGKPSHTHQEDSFFDTVPITLLCSSPSFSRDPVIHSESLIWLFYPQMVSSLRTVIVISLLHACSKVLNNKRMMVCLLALLGCKQREWILANLNGNINLLEGYQVIRKLAMKLED